MRDGELDAFFLVAGVPTNAIAILGEEVEIDLLPVDGSAAEWLLAEYPFFAFNLIPAETYTGTIGDSFAERWGAVGRRGRGR